MLVLEGKPGEVPAIVRLRGLLKTALRGFGLRCITAVETPANTQTRESTKADVREIGDVV